MRKNHSSHEKNIKASYDKLYKQHEKLLQKNEDLSNQKKKLKIQTQNAEKETKRLRENLENTVEQKYKLEEDLEYKKQIIRKLENYVKVTGKGDPATTFTVKEENSKLLKQIEDLKNTLEQYKDHVRVLSKGLEIRCEDYGLGDIRGNILCDLAETKDQLQQASEVQAEYKQIISHLQSDLEVAETNIQELKFIRQSNNEELMNLQRQMINLTKEKETTQFQLSELQEENRRLIEYIDHVSQNESVPVEEVREQIQLETQELASKYENSKRVQSQMETELENYREQISNLYYENENLTAKEKVTVT